MSRYPGNPWWDQDYDVPITIMSRSEWDEAAAAGYVTPEHVFLRLRNAANFAFGNPIGIAFDEDGFVVALTSAGFALEGGVKLSVHPNDHPPPHVHVTISSHPNAKIRIELTTGELLDDLPRGLAAKKLKGIQSAVRENHAVLAGWWRDYHGGPINVG
ncbi:DUF4160 domain-containing protein [Mycolicibacterium sp. 120266]|uniref:DUF4160 domain-containing protein n=1 Tax=Mycolicibacterium sp. 120266 TaxID=3090601 RepID=UPI00299D37D0|nr:DUF4160 domain-containing protein [Mycolicibacterium sp. 120266]MDX1874057.1 DUF4160 domain-containing protein [Mycolicibacterium sp. 120266]